MKTPNSPALTAKERKPRKAITALKITIYRRKGSRCWQALIRLGKTRKRITTRTTHPGAAQEFAELAYRHFARESRKSQS